MKKSRIFLMMGIMLVIIGLAIIPYCNDSVEAFDRVNIEDEYIYVTVSGEVLRKGIYEVPKDWKLSNLLDLCGLDKNADLSEINMLEVLESNKTYHIPSKEEETHEIEMFIFVNINVASKEELDRLPGIGPELAEAIILYRLTSPFKNIEEIMLVDGIGKATYEKIKSHIFV